MKKFLRVFVICVGLFFAIDNLLYIAFGFKCIDTLLKLLGIEAGVNGVPKWIIIVVGIALLIFAVEYDVIWNYLFESEDQRKYK